MAELRLIIDPSSVLSSFSETVYNINLIKSYHSDWLNYLSTA